jgi:hypothetical protein
MREAEREKWTKGMLWDDVICVLDDLDESIARTEKAIRERDEVGVQLQAAQQMIAQLAKGLPLADLGVVRGDTEQK